MGRKVWGRGATVTAADINTYLMDQSVMTFATAAARTTAIPSPTQGMVTWRNNASGPIKLEYYDGSSWVAISFSSPAQTVQGQSSIVSTTIASIAGSTARNTWSSWTSVGTSPASLSYLTDVGWQFGQGQSTTALIELSLDGGTTVWRRFMTGGVGANTVPGGPVTPRSCPASSTIHLRFKLSATADVGGNSVFGFLTFTQTAPTVTTSVAESLWEDNSGSAAAYGSWVTLGTVGAAHRLVACHMPTDASTGGGLATGAGSAVIARWKNYGFECRHGGNRAVPAGALKASGYTAFGNVWVLTEPV